MNDSFKLAGRIIWTVGATLLQPHLHWVTGISSAEGLPREGSDNTDGDSSSDARRLTDSDPDPSNEDDDGQSSSGIGECEDS